MATSRLISDIGYEGEMDEEESTFIASLILPLRSNHHISKLRHSLKEIDKILSNKD